MICSMHGAGCGVVPMRGRAARRNSRGHLESPQGSTQSSSVRRLNSRRPVCSNMRMSASAAGCARHVAPAASVSDPFWRRRRESAAVETPFFSKCAACRQRSSCERTDRRRPVKMKRSISWKRQLQALQPWRAPSFALSMPPLIIHPAPPRNPLGLPPARIQSPPRCSVTTGVERHQGPRQKRAAPAPGGRGIASGDNTVGGDPSVMLPLGPAAEVLQRSEPALPMV